MYLPHKPRLFHDGIRPASTPPKIVVLNFSGGGQSTALAQMLLQGEIPMPPHLLVLSADPGMEKSETYRIISETHEKFRQRGITAVTVPGPNLYDDLTRIQADTSRMDNPPYFTVNPQTGKRGRLLQKCTRFYKIAPMDRYLRIYLDRKFGISQGSKRLGSGIVEKWIGITADEAGRRTSLPRRKYIRFFYPLAALGLTKQDTAAKFTKWGLPVPPRSVCAACFAHDGASIQDARTRPAYYNQMLAVDGRLRDFGLPGARDDLYMTSHGLRVEDITPENGGGDMEGCTAGYCFV